MSAVGINPFASIRARLIALALVPLALISSIFAAYGIHHGLEHDRWRIDEIGRVIAESLALAAERSLRTGEIEHLQALCDETARRPDVLWAAIGDIRFNLLVASAPEEQASQAGHPFSAPVVNLGDSITIRPPDSRPPPTPISEPILGWVQIRLTPTAGAAPHQQHLVILLWLILAGLGLGILAALYIGRDLSRGLGDIGKTIARYRQGEFAARARPQPIAELDALARAFNRMANQIDGSQQAMRNQVEAATRQLRWSLETLQKQNAQLERAREAALAANQDKEAFLARMSHEMRTPLNAVIGFGRLLHAEARTEASAEYSRTLDRAARQLLAVIDDILNYVRLNSSELSIESAPFEPRDCLEDIVAMLAPDAHANGLELALVIHGGVPERLRGDPSRISQVLVNLLSNAIKFTSVGHVLVEADYDAGEAGSLRMVVSDTGIGLSAAQQLRLFQPFEQADPVITRRYGGTGLGLAISKRLVELMGGQIRVRSALNQGSRFSVTLPCQRCSPVPSQRSRRYPKARKVLICDPAAIQVRALRSQLLSWSMEVFATSDPQRLPTMLVDAEGAGRHFELLILGLAPQQQKVLELERQLAELRRAFSGPILLLVANNQWTPPPAVLATPPIAWTEKPLRRARLIELLCQLDGVSRSAGAVEQARTRAQFPGRRAMVVDDNDFNRALMRRLLEVRAMEVIEVDNGADAVRQATRLELDLIVIDIHMPLMDGIEATRRIRAALADEQVPSLVALSADAFVTERIPERAALFDAVLLKPIDEEGLDETLERLLADGSATSLQTGHRPDRPAAPVIDPGPVRAIRLDTEWRTRLDDELAMQVQGIGAAIAVEDRQALQERLHDLKGICGLFGLQGLTERVRGLSDMAATAPMATLCAEARVLKNLLGEESKREGCTGP
ncbi:hybrid sensor histidine kinase/response regulator [Halochromatium glycolicum]|nr:hybrid sensor histidine kinase/response regulator [Halochromatium glycolicum]